MLGWKRWQWAVIVSPVVVVGLFLLGAAGWQIHRWGLSWLWGVFAVVLLGWRWLLVRWTRPLSDRVDTLLHQAEATVAPQDTAPDGAGDVLPQIQEDFQALVTATREDPPLWEDWGYFWQRCQDTVSLVARAYHPEVKYPLLNIYVPQAYGLMRGTVDDLDSWMRQLSPVLNQVTVGQAVQAYETYHRLAPSAQRLWRVWNWAQWVINPATAVARTVSQPQNRRAQEQLIGNLGQLLREAALRQLCQQAIALYGGQSVSLPAPETSPAPPAASQNTQTLRDILTSAQPQSAIELKPVNVMLVGRTGAGKSSVINTLFEAERATVDLLPSTDRIQRYRWQAATGEQLTLWDTPGYGQVDRPDYRETLLAQAGRADLILLVTPALDPALDMDRDWLQSLRQTHESRPTIGVVTQVDRLRPIREWDPPYDWQGGDRPKEVAIRDAVAYRQSQLGEWCRQVVPLVTRDGSGDRGDRAPWNRGPLSTQLLESLPPAQQQRLARFLRDRDARIQGAARLIDRYTRQMATQQGLTALLKSPVLQFIATLTTGNPGFAYVLAEQIPVERLPIVIGKLQLAYELFQLLADGEAGTSAATSEPSRFDLLTLWPLLLKDTAAPPDQQAWAWGHTLVAYWTRDMSSDQLGQTFEQYLNRYGG